MKKRLLATLILVITLVSCGTTGQQLTGAYNMINCKYNYNSISNMNVAGMNLANGLSLTNIAKATSILTGSASSIPLDFTVNLDVNNPNTSAAMLQGLQYVISVDGIDFTSGNVNQTMNIAAGGTQTLPINIGVDLASLFKTNSKDAVLNIAKNFIGLSSEKSNVSIQLKPTFMVGSVPVTSPVYIPVSFSFGGK